MVKRSPCSTSGGRSARANLVTENVDPQMRVMARRYLSARGKGARFLLLSVVVFIVALSSCGDRKPERLPDEAFREIYGELLYRAELYRGDTLRLRHEFDSLLAAYDTDSSTLYATAEDIATDRQRVDELYRLTIERFERLSRGPDSTSADSTGSGVSGDRSAEEGELY